MFIASAKSDYIIYSEGGAVSHDMTIGILTGLDILAFITCAACLQQQKSRLFIVVLQIGPRLHQHSLSSPERDKPTETPKAQFQDGI